MAHWAIIGAGLAGVTLAKALSSKHDVTIFEKSHSSAGRMSSRRRQAGDQVYAFDHGAQYFTIKTDAFQKALIPYMEQGIVQPWHARMVTIADQGQSVTPRSSGQAPNQPSRQAYVATPGMTGLVKAMASGLVIQHSTEIRACDRHQKGWVLTDTDGATHGHFDGVVTAIPAQQVMPLIPSAEADLKQVKMLGCFTVMLGFDGDKAEIQNWPIEWDAAYVEGSKIGFIAVNSSKPGRGEKSGEKSCLVVQANNIWADQHLDANPDDIEKILHQELQDWTGIKASDATLTSFHRWRYAATQTPLGHAFWRHHNGELAAIGDWCIKGRVEAAFESASALAASILND